MTPQEIHSRLTARLGEAVGPMAGAKGDPWFTVRKDALVEACRILKEDPELAMEALEDLTALDWPARNLVELVLHLFSFRLRHGVVMKVELDRAAPRAPTLSAVWRAAEWFEREVLDLFGVEFEGHPDPRRILLPDDWEGHPLRKDYREAGGWHGIGNERENPLVELRRLDETRRAEVNAARPASPAPPPPPPAPAPSQSALAQPALPERRAGEAGPESRDPESRD
jgi:NADH-quinone oxidoreductase subunit C